jgi:cytochrome c oxidase subunit IV
VPADADRRVRRPPGPPPWQFLVRAVLVLVGLTLLLVVDVHGVAFYVAWSLIVLALISEAAATLVHWRRDRARPGG